MVYFSSSSGWYRPVEYIAWSEESATSMVPETVLIGEKESRNIAFSSSASYSSFFAGAAESMRKRSRSDCIGLRKGGRYLPLTFPFGSWSVQESRRERFAFSSSFACVMERRSQILLPLGRWSDGHDENATNTVDPAAAATPAPVLLVSLLAEASRRVRP